MSQALPKPAEEVSYLRCEAYLGGSVATLSSADDTPTTPLSEIVIELTFTPERLSNAAVMLAAVSKTA